MNTNQLDAALEDLRGLAPKQIAAMIARRKIKGRPGTTGGCPLAVLMHGAHGGSFIVGQKFVIRRTGHDAATILKRPTPPNLAAFVRMFDSGQFPELIRVPPRCEPKRPRGSGPSGKKHPRGKTKLHLARDAERFPA